MNAIYFLSMKICCKGENKKYNYSFHFTYKKETNTMHIPKMIVAIGHVGCSAATIVGCDMAKIVVCKMVNGVGHTNSVSIVFYS